MKNKCCANPITIIDDTPTGFPCGNSGTIKRGENYYCWQHDPHGNRMRRLAALKSSATQKRNRAATERKSD